MSKTPEQRAAKREYRERRAYISETHEETLRITLALRDAFLVTDDEQARVALESATTLDGVASNLRRGAQQ
jgi:hypothetical protein